MLAISAAGCDLRLLGEVLRRCAAGTADVVPYRGAVRAISACGVLAAWIADAVGFFLAVLRVQRSRNGRRGALSWRCACHQCVWGCGSARWFQCVARGAINACGVRRFAWCAAGAAESAWVRSDSSVQSLLVGAWRCWWRSGRALFGFHAAEGWTYVGADAMSFIVAFGLACWLVGGG